MVRIQQLGRLCWMENNGDFMEDMGYGVARFCQLNRLKVMGHGYIQPYITNLH